MPEVDNTPEGAVLQRLEEEIYLNNVAHGWYDGERTFGDDIALLHSELSEALDAFRSHGFKDMTYDSLHSDSLPKPEGVGSELADVFIRLLDTARRRGIDLPFEIRRKMAYNKTRPYKHGGKAL